MNQYPKPLQLAQLNWTDEGYPVSAEYGDKYFSGNGLAESDCVFLQGNQLPQRWQEHPTEIFTVLETGFGSGLNFLLCLQLWQDAIDKGGVQAKLLRYFSIEKSPVSIQDLQTIYKLWPQHSTNSNRLLKKLPQPVPGRHLLKFYHGNHCLELILIYTDIEAALKELVEEDLTRVDAFFLDGFSPAKNPQMWQLSVFKALQELANNNATAATYSASSSVKKLLNGVGFTVSKTKGFGNKREMLTARVNLNKTKIVIRKTLQQQKILVIGAGLAGAITAAKLAERGHFVDVVDSGKHLCTGASGNAAGIAYPRLGNNYAEPCQLQLCGDSFLHAELMSLENVTAEFNGIDFLFGQHNPNTRLNNNTLQRLNLKKNYIKNALTLNNNRLEFLKAGWIEPASLAQAYLNPYLENKQISLFYDCNVKAINFRNNFWEVTASNNIAKNKYAFIYICTGSELANLLPQYQPFTTAVRGQIDCFKVSEKHSEIKRPLCSKGYIIPYSQNNSGETVYWVGASYQNDVSSKKSSSNETEIHRQRLSKFIQLPADKITHLESRVATRLSSGDRMPLVGQAASEQSYCNWYANKKLCSQKPLIPGLFVNVAHGSHGLISIPILSEFVVRQSLQEPSLITRPIENAVDPQRYFRRKVKNGS